MPAAALLVVVLAVLSPPAAARPLAPAAPDPAPVTTVVSPTRADLALAYFRLDAAMTTFSGTGERLLEIGLALDRAGASFLTGGQAAVHAAMVELADSVLLPAPDEPCAALARTLRARIDPPVFVIGGAARPRLRLERLAEPDADLPAEPITLAVEAGGSGDWVSSPIRAKVTVAPRGPLPGPIECTLPAGGLRPGRYTVRIGPPGRRAMRPTAVWTVVEADPDEVRARNDAAVDDLEHDGALATPDLRRAAAAFRARNALLSANPAPHEPARYNADQSHLPALLSQELEALRFGRSPYADYPGDLWRTYHVAGADVPVRVFNPPRGLRHGPSSRRPLVIALHGAAGDESMFPDGYGGGVMRSLAEDHGFVLCSPRTGPFAAGPAFFDNLVREVAADYPIDPQRIYVVGHSMGSGVAGAWATLRHDRIAAAACIAGFTAFRPEQEVCPTLVIAPGRDRLVDPQRTIAAARAAAASGLPIEPRFLPDATHTLVVGRVLPEVIPWLLDHRLADAPEPAAR